MKALRQIALKRASVSRQRGVSLFFALVCLLSIMLAAVALVRSVDTSTLISGNLAFQQSATSSGDAGTEAAIAWLATVEAANTSTNVLNDPAHPFNEDDAANGYYSSLDTAKSLTSGGFLWTDADSKVVGTDSSGNAVRYIVQRMCRNPNVPVKDAGCLFSGAIQDTSGQNVPLPQEICKGVGCPVAGQTPQLRITSRTDGPKNTRSYVQAFVY